MDWALDEIHKIQKAARSGKPIAKPRWPLLVLRTIKGLGAPKSIHGTTIEGSFHSHQVPLPKAKSDPEELKALQDWLASYKPRELFDEQGKPRLEVVRLIPEVNEKKLGQRNESYAGYRPLDLPEWKQFVVEQGTEESCMKAIGRFLEQVIAKYGAFSISCYKYLISLPGTPRHSASSRPMNSPRTN